MVSHNSYIYSNQWAVQWGILCTKGNYRLFDNYCKPSAENLPDLAVCKGCYIKTTMYKYIGMWTHASLVSILHTDPRMKNAWLYNHQESTYLTIIPWVCINWIWVGHNHLISSRCKWNNCFIYLKTPPKYWEFFLTFCKNNRFSAYFLFWADAYSYHAYLEHGIMVHIPWWLSQSELLELHYPLI